MVLRTPKDLLERIKAHQASLERIFPLGNEATH